MRNADEVVNGILRYAEHEVMPKLDTKSKIIMGTALGMATSSLDKAINALQGNELAQMIGAVNEDGLLDVDLIADNLKASSERYGNLSFTIPFTGGVMSFSPNDIDDVKRYINNY